MGQIYCGANPMLYARKVLNLRAVGDDDYSWDEPAPLPQALRDALARAQEEDRRAQDADGAMGRPSSGNS
jgi:hypothetical protein